MDKLLAYISRPATNTLDQVGLVWGTVCFMKNWWIALIVTILILEYCSIRLEKRYHGTLNGRKLK